MSEAGRANAMSWVLAVGFSVAMAVVAGRVWVLKVWPEEALASRLTDCVAVKELPARRGDIRDRRSRLLAISRFANRAVADPTLLPLDMDAWVGELAAAAGVDASELGSRLMEAVAHNRGLGWVHADERPRQKTDAEIRAELMALLRERLGFDPPREEAGEIRGLRRYVRVSGVLTEEQERAVRALGIPGVTFESVAVREYPVGGSAAAIVGKLGAEKRWSVGSERVFDGLLEGESGQVHWVHDAWGDPLWIEAGALQPATPGEDVTLSIDLEVQRIAEEELSRAVEEADAAGGRCMVVDPLSGEVLAMVDVIRDVPGIRVFPWAEASGGGVPEFEAGGRYAVIEPDAARRVESSLARVRCVTDVYEPGSVFKPFVWSSLTEMGKARIEEVFETGGQVRASNGRLIRDVVRPGKRTWEEVLEWSSNIGMSAVAMRASHEELRRAVLRFGFGSRTGVGLPGESAGLVQPAGSWGDYTQQSVSFGQEVGVTVAQLARAFTVFARPGELAGTLVPLRLEASEPPGAPAIVMERVLSVETALMTRDIMRVVAGRMLEKYRRVHPEEDEPKFDLFGKSGTAQVAIGSPPEGKVKPRGARGYLEGQYISSFVAGAPADDPRLVIVVVVEDPGPEAVRGNRYYGSDVAGPAVSRIADRTLLYMGSSPRVVEGSLAKAR